MLFVFNCNLSVWFFQFLYFLIACLKPSASWKLLDSTLRFCQHCNHYQKRFLIIGMILNGKSFGKSLPWIALFQILLWHRHLFRKIRKIQKIKVGLKCLKCLALLYWRFSFLIVFNGTLNRYTQILLANQILNILNCMNNIWYLIYSISFFYAALSDILHIELPNSIYMQLHGSYVQWCFNYVSMLFFLNCDFNNNVCGVCSKIFS